VVIVKTVFYKNETYIQDKTDSKIGAAIM